MVVFFLSDVMTYPQTKSSSNTGLIMETTIIVRRLSFKPAKPLSDPVVSVLEKKYQAAARKIAYAAYDAVVSATPISVPLTLILNPIFNEVSGKYASTG